MWTISLRLAERTRFWGRSGRLRRSTTSERAFGDVFDRSLASAERTETRSQPKAVRRRPNAAASASAHLQVASSLKRNTRPPRQIRAAMCKIL